MSQVFQKTSVWKVGYKRKEKKIKIVAWIDNKMSDYIQNIVLIIFLGVIHKEYQTFWWVRSGDAPEPRLGLVLARAFKKKAHYFQKLSS